MCVSVCVFVHLHFIECVQLVFSGCVCAFICVYMCVCVSEMTCSAAAQHKLTTFVRSLCLSCHIKTPHYLLLCHWNSDCSFFTINLLNMLSHSLPLLLCLPLSFSLRSLCHRLLRQRWVTVSSFSFETII